MLSGQAHVHLHPGKRLSRQGGRTPESATSGVCFKCLLIAGDLDPDLGAADRPDRERVISSPRLVALPRKQCPVTALSAAGATCLQVRATSGLHGTPGDSGLHTRQAVGAVPLLPGRNAHLVSLAVTEYLSRSSSHQPERKTA